jgi:hypothetical protein
MFGGKRKLRSTMVVNRNDTGTHWRGTILENRKGLWYPLEGHHGGEKKDTGTHWRGTMVVNRKGSWYPLEGHQGGEQKETLESTIGTQW